MTTPARTQQPDDMSDSPETAGRSWRIRWRRLNPAMKYAVVLITLALIAVAGQFVLHARNTEPRDSRGITDRELQVNVLEPGEHVVSTISAFRRAPIDYF